jgi:hypothetical protein
VMVSIGVPGSPKRERGDYGTPPPWATAEPFELPSAFPALALRAS